MSIRLLEILGRGVITDVSELILQWFDVVRLQSINKRKPFPEKIEKICGLVSSNKLDTARDMLRLYLFDAPNCLFGRMAAAMLYLRQNNIKDALNELNSVYVRQPNNTMALYALGHCYEREMKSAEAAEFYQDCLKFKKHLHLPRQRLAAIHFKNKQIEHTIEEYELLRTEYPEEITTPVLLGYLYILNKQYQKAIDIFNIAILMHPDNYYMENDNIDMMIRDGEYQDALEAIESDLQEQPHRIDLIAKRGDVLAMMGDTDESIAQYEDALKLCPDFLEATVKLGTQYLQASNEEYAAMQFNKAFEINEKIADAYIGLAIAQKKAGKTSEALGTLSLATAIEANSPILYSQLSVIKYGLEFKSTGGLNSLADVDIIEKILALYQRNIEQNPSNPDLYYRYGLILMAVRREKDALECFAKAIGLNPTHCRARKKYAVCLFNNGLKEKAVEVIDAGDNIDDAMIELHYKTALLSCDKIKFASSLLNLDKSMEENFVNGNTINNISIVLQNLGVLNRAEMMWESLADIT